MIAKNLKPIPVLIDWDELSLNMPLSEANMEKNWRYINKQIISYSQILSEEFIMRHIEELDMFQVLYHQRLSEDAILEMEMFYPELFDRLLWIIAATQNVSEAWFNVHYKSLKSAIFRFCTVSEGFLEEHWNDIPDSELLKIASFQQLSENFILKHWDKLHIVANEIALHQKLSKEFCEKTGVAFLEEKNNSRITETEFKYMIKDLNMYETHKDYFIAYMPVKANSQGEIPNTKYDFYRGNIYYIPSDWCNVFNSYGITAYSKKRANGFISAYANDNKILKVKIEYKHLTYVSPLGIRCNKIEVL